MQIDGVLELWLAARAHAGLADAPVHLYPYEVPPALDVPTAAFFEPGDSVSDLEARPLTRAQRRDSNDHRDDPRILLFTGPEDAVVAAKLRHELEHVRQWRCVPHGRKLFKVYRTVIDAFDAFVGVDNRGSAVLYNLVPFESDANAAAYEFSRQRLAEPDMRRLEQGSDGVLFRPGHWAADIATVALRSVCAAALAPQRVEKFLGGASDTRRLLDEVTGRTGLWRELCDMPELAAIRSDLRRRIPTTAAIDAAAPAVAEPWRPLAGAMAEAIDATVETLT
jgi:hypothetical protein